MHTTVNCVYVLVKVYKCSIIYININVLNLVEKITCLVLDLQKAERGRSRVPDSLVSDKNFLKLKTVVPLKLLYYRDATVLTKE